ncbi:hypothetical protein DB347_08595 [Opitutaceae bacterium EW11]|nr:hypothetical protein DB347_08595 [Opitutaceae bacterium EW11]
MLTRSLLLALATASSFALVGCRDAKIASYRVRKEAAPPQPQMAMTGASAELPKVHWQTPAGWQEQPSGNVRIGSFLVTATDGRKADMSITQFPGTVGGDLANINRWRGQLQLGPIAEQDLANAFTTSTVPSGTYSIADIISDQPIIEGKYRGRILGAWLKTPERTWFFKLSGESELVGANRDAFMEFLKSVTFEAPAAGTSMSDLAAPDVSAAPIAQNTALLWTAPADWTAKTATQMRKGSYTLHGASGGEADLSIISFPGEAGGIVQNLNRWRGQVQLPPLSPTELASSSHTLANGNLRFTVVDFLGTTSAGPTRLLGAVLPLENETYFFKLIGPDAVVTQHKEGFMAFLKTVKTP